MMMALDEPAARKAICDVQREEFGTVGVAAAFAACRLRPQRTGCRSQTAKARQPAAPACPASSSATTSAAGDAGERAAIPCSTSRRRADAQPLRTSKFRLVVEFALLFAVALLLKQFLVGGSGTPYPNPLWLPVIVLSLEHGLAAGLASTIIATALQFSGGFPPVHLTRGHVFLYRPDRGRAGQLGLRRRC